MIKEIKLFIEKKELERERERPKQRQADRDSNRQTDKKGEVQRQLLNSVRNLNRKKLIPGDTWGYRWQCGRDAKKENEGYLMFYLIQKESTRCNG